MNSQLKYILLSTALLAWLSNGCGRQPSAVSEPEAQSAAPATHVNSDPPKGSLPEKLPVQQMEPEHAAPVKKNVLLDKAYTTSNQDGMQKVPLLKDEYWRRVHASAHELIRGNNHSTAFLIVTTDIHAAVLKTKQILEYGTCVDTVDLRSVPDDSGSGEPTLIWLFVLLGSEASMWSWELSEVTITNNVITARCRRIAPVLNFAMSPSEGVGFWLPIQEIHGPRQSSGATKGPRDSTAFLQLSYTQPCFIKVFDDRSEESYFSRRILFRSK